MQESTTQRAGVGAIVLAGGTGSRFGSDRNKVFAILEGLPLLFHTLACFRRVPELVLVVHPRDRADLEQNHRAELARCGLAAMVDGGDRRQDSVHRGLSALSSGCEVVAIHDAARPLVSAELVDRVVEAAFACGAAIPAVPIAETIKRSNEQGEIETTVDRRDLYAAQTPQAFRRALIVEAHRRHRESGNGLATDDASMVESIGERVRIVPGDPLNVKVTQARDLELVRAFHGYFRQKESSEHGDGDAGRNRV